MNQRTHLGTTYLDIAKGAVETFMKVPALPCERRRERARVTARGGEGEAGRGGLPGPGARGEGGREGGGECVCVRAGRGGQGRAGPCRAEPGGSGGGAAASRLTLCFVPRAAAPSPGPGQQGRQVHAGHFRGASLRYQGNPRSPHPPLPSRRSPPASFRPLRAAAGRCRRPPPRPPRPGCRRSGGARHTRAPAAAAAALTSTWPTFFPCVVCVSSNELWGIFIQVGRSDSNSKESSAWKGRAGEGPTSARRARTRKRTGLPPAPPGRGQAYRGGRGRWVHMTQGGEPVGGRFGVRSASIWKGLRESRVSGRKVCASVTSQKFVPWNKSNTFI